MKTGKAPPPDSAEPVATAKVHTVCLSGLEAIESGAQAACTVRGADQRCTSWTAVSVSACGKTNTRTGQGHLHSEGLWEP